MFLLEKLPNKRHNLKTDGKTYFLKRNSMSTQKSARVRIRDIINEGFDWGLMDTSKG